MVVKSHFCVKANLCFVRFEKILEVTIFIFREEILERINGMLSVTC